MTCLSSSMATRISRPPQPLRDGSDWGFISGWWLSHPPECVNWGSSFHFYMVEKGDMCFYVFNLLCFFLYGKTKRCQNIFGTTKQIMSIVGTKWNQVLHILMLRGGSETFLLPEIESDLDMIYDIWYIIWFFHDDLPNFTRFFHVGSYLSNPLLWSLGWFMIPQVQAALQVPNAMLQRSSKLTGAKVTTLKVKNRFSTYKMYESWCLIWYVVKSSL